MMKRREEVGEKARRMEPMVKEGDVMVVCFMFMFMFIVVVADYEDSI